MITKEAVEILEKTAVWGALGRFAAKGISGLGKGLGSAGQFMQRSAKAPTAVQEAGKKLQGAGSFLTGLGKSKATAMKTPNPLSLKQKAGIGTAVLTGAGMIGSASSNKGAIADLKAPTSSDYPYHQQI